MVVVGVLYIGEFVLLILIVVGEEGLVGVVYGGSGSGGGCGWCGCGGGGWCGGGGGDEEGLPLQLSPRGSVVRLRGGGDDEPHSELVGEDGSSK